MLYIVKEIWNLLSLQQRMEYQAESSLWKDYHMSLREKCLYSEFFWFVFSNIWIEYGEILRIFPNSVRM